VEDIEHFLLAQLLLGLEVVEQFLSPDQLGDDVEVFAVLLQSVDLDDVGVVLSGEGATMFFRI
jgi:hypothetical protein